MFETITALLQPWADYYAEHTTLSTAVVAAHLLAMFVGGGLAIGADRRLLLAEPGTPEAYRAAAADLQAQHGLVIASLVGIVVSGLALATADAETYLTSRIYWAKMGTFALLLLNGLRMRRTEAQLLRAVANTTELSVAGPQLTLPWGALRQSAGASFALWCVVLLLGVVVANS